MMMSCVCTAMGTCSLGPTHCAESRYETQVLKEIWKTADVSRESVIRADYTGFDEGVDGRQWRK